MISSIWSFIAASNVGRLMRRITPTGGTTYLMQVGAPVPNNCDLAWNGVITTTQPY